MKILYFFFGLIIFLFVGAGFWLLSGQVPKPFILRLDNAGIVLGYILSCLTIAAATIAWFRRQDIRKWLKLSRFKSVGAPFDVPEGKVTCMVIPVSRQEQPEWILRWLKPRYVSLLYTEAKQSVAAQLAETFSQPPYQIHFFPDAASINEKYLMLANPDDPQESKNIVELFLQRFLKQGYPPENIFVDTTGGKVPMSIGAFQAAEEAGISSVYIVGTVNGLIKNPKKREHGQPVFISNHTKKAG